VACPHESWRPPKRSSGAIIPSLLAAVPQGEGAPSHPSCSVFGVRSLRPGVTRSGGGSPALPHTPARLLCCRAPACGRALCCWWPCLPRARSAPCCWRGGRGRWWAGGGGRRCGSSLRAVVRDRNAGMRGCGFRVRGQSKLRALHHPRELHPPGWAQQLPVCSPGNSNQELQACSSCRAKAARQA